MEYSVQELAKLSGVTPRALRWYDRIGLLKPARTAESGYRYYGPDEVDRLQEILFCRELGMELKEIGAYLDRPEPLSVTVVMLKILFATREVPPVTITKAA